MKVALLLVAWLPLVYAACPPGFDPITIDFADASVPVTEIDGFVFSAGGALGIYPTDASGGEDPDLEVGLGNALILQDPSTTEPSDDENGGTIVVTFPEVLYLESITLIDTEQAPRLVVKANQDVSTDIMGPVLPNGTFVVLQSGMNSEELSTSFELILPSSGALAQINLCDAPRFPPQSLPEYPSCPDGFYQQVIDFNDFAHNQRANPLQVNGFTASIGGGPTLNIYDTSGEGIPPGIERDLEVDVGNALIIQQTGVESYPDDNISGGLIKVQFPYPMYLVGLTLVAMQVGPTIWTKLGNQPVTTRLFGPSMADGQVAFFEVQDEKVDFFRLRNKQAGGIVNWVVCTPCPEGYTHHVVDFAGYSHGDDVTIVNDFDFTDSSGPLKIFDSDTVHENDVDLQLGAGNLVVLHNVTSPYPADDRRDGGNIKVHFPSPGFVKTVTVVDVEKTARIVTKRLSESTVNVDKIKVPRQDGKVNVVEVNSGSIVDFLRVRIPGADAFGGFEVCLEDPVD